MLIDSVVYFLHRVLFLDKDDNIITDPVSIANSLQDHFKGVFSSPNANLQPLQNFVTPVIKHPMPKFYITEREIVDAINEMKSHSAVPQSAIPTRIFKECKWSLSLPLRLFWEKSFRSGLVPSAYKFHQTIPKHKKGPKSSPSNFRPIVLTPPEIKIFERVMRKKLTMHFEVNEFFKSSQHGFRKHRSCLTQLLFHTQNIFDKLLSNDTVDSLYIDYAKAFDKVDHSILMQKLELYGVSDEYLVWIKSFLTNRKQVVFINNACSYEVEVVSGVPQGSVLGPLFFITSTNDLPDHISHCSLLSFADDTKLVLPINTSEDTQRLKKDLQSVISWSFNNFVFDVGRHNRF